MNKNLNTLPVLLAIILTACPTTIGQIFSGPSAGEPSSRPMYYGYGVAPGKTEALKAAKKEAVKTAAKDLLGAAAAAKTGEIDNLIHSIDDFNSYVYVMSLQKLNQGAVNSQNYCQIGVRVNLEYLANKLRAHGLYGGQVLPEGGSTPKLVDRPSPLVDSGVSAGQTSVYANLSEAESQFLENYVNNLTYMVYFDEKQTSVDPYLMEAAITGANHYLEKNDFRYINLKQIEALKKDQEIAFEEAAGDSGNIMRWLAGKLNADIYVEINLSVSSGGQPGFFYSTANVILNSYESATAEGRGAASRQTIPPAISLISEKDAVNNAVVATIGKAMPEALKNIRITSGRALAKGIKYFLIIQNPPESRLMLGFEKQLLSQVKSLRRISYSVEEIQYEVFVFAEQGDLERQIYRSSDFMPELSDMYLVLQQRNTLIFNSGL